MQQDDMDFSLVFENLEEARAILKRLHGKSLLGTKDIKVDTPKVMSEIRRVHDLLAFSAAQVNNEMWCARGERDMIGSA